MHRSDFVDALLNLPLTVQCEHGTVLRVRLFAPGWTCLAAVVHDSWQTCPSYPELVAAWEAARAAEHAVPQVRSEAEAFFDLRYQALVDRDTEWTQAVFHALNAHMCYSPTYNMASTVSTAVDAVSFFDGF